MFLFDRFPCSDPDLLNKWLEALNLTDFVPDKKDLVCSDHFEINCFRLKGKNSSLCLKRNAEVVSEVENNKSYNISHEITMADDYHQEINNSTPKKRSKKKKKSARFARTFSSRASLARISAPGARDLMVVALRAPTYVNFALSVARFIALGILV